MSTLNSFIQALPKVELHLHIEGSLEPELMFEIAQRNNIELPFSTVSELRKAYQFENLQQFLDLYYQGMNVLQTEQDFYQLTLAYLEKVKQQNVRHVEIFWDPQGHLERGIAFEVQVKGITQALTFAQQNLDISSRLIMSFLRHLPEQSALETLTLAEPFLEHIYAAGLDSSEQGHPPEKFKHVFSACRDKGLKLTMHAGEEGPADYIWQALDVIKVDRIDHGNRSLEDKSLVAKLVETGHVLTVCPLSNLKLNVVKDLSLHPTVAMLNAGLNITINSDDPAYFGGYMVENYQQLQTALNLNSAQLIQLARNAITGSWAEPERKQQLLNELEHCIKQYNL